jgi:hypothetical protein
VVHLGGDLAVTIGFQSGECTGNANEFDEVRLRVMHVFRREQEMD